MSEIIHEAKKTVGLTQLRLIKHDGCYELRRGNQDGVRITIEELNDLGSAMAVEAGINRFWA